MCVDTHTYIFVYVLTYFCLFLLPFHFSSSHQFDTRYKREGMEVAAMSQASLLKDRLLNQGANHFVIFTSVGEVLEWSGDFQNEEKRLLAYTVAQQASTLLRPGEELKRISMVFDNVAYVTTTIAGPNEHFGIVVKRAVSDALEQS
ncbi:hypothetical protein, conserved [Trypanosoma brucei gambiense DAL972]|uniref:Roadblock/LAMTOR2 domain-containing protein n=1 Tax=Trypanosoma brucei gambiense (strain MHOM/CI/86/DAL972) TaxID=679716 RepID=C9ZLP6_TRYB9|nr:hypothetical protein, conserved [Trypanosoma brucei gambiense DAL972]CBH10321.1 hypothetical protein, conserved [Trypanosoma brucei gambiense DAL972]|eukprot:XP_011772611.1 hypothetical protein, conserved [Trypanosoma brucei gambiense DAL972]